MLVIMESSPKERIGRNFAWATVYNSVGNAIGMVLISILAKNWYICGKEHDFDYTCCPHGNRNNYQTPESFLISLIIFFFETLFGIYNIAKKYIRIKAAVTGKNNRYCLVCHTKT